MRERRRIRPGFGLLALLAFLAWHLDGSTRLNAAVLRNDSIEDFSNVAIQAGFVANERAAAWLTSSCEGNLTAVQVLWMSVTGGSGHDRRDSSRGLSLLRGAARYRTEPRVSRSSLTAASPGTPRLGRARSSK